MDGLRRGYPTVENLAHQRGIRPASLIASGKKTLGIRLMRKRGLFIQVHASGKKT
jgi:hypothetical protein